MMLDFEIRTHLLYHLVIQVGTIVGNDLPRESVPTNPLPLDESDHYTPPDIGVGNLFFLIRGMEEIFLVRKSNVCVNSFIVLGIYFFKI